MAQKEPRRMRLNHPMVQAILRVIELKKVTERPDYRSVGARFDVNPETLRQYYCKWKQGKLHLPVPVTQEDLAFDIITDFEQTRQLLYRHRAAARIVYEAALVKGEEMLLAGDPEGLKKSGALNAKKEMDSIIDSIKRLEKERDARGAGQRAAMEEQMETMKSVHGTEVSLKIVAAADEQSMLHALTHDDGDASLPSEAQA